jgi:hypothetical protein
VLYAADGHLQSGPVETPARRGIASFFNGYRTAEMFLRPTLGKDMVTIGTYVGTGEGFRGPRPLNADGVEGLLSSLKSSYFLDLRGTRPPATVLQWLSAVHTVNEGLSLALRSAADGHDLILYIDRVTPAKRAL